MVSAWARTNGIVLAQEKVSDKSNEITAIPELLNVLEIKGCIVTIDAMGCQKEIAGKIKAKDADYVLALKSNQKKLFEDVQLFLGHLDKPSSRQIPPDFCCKTVFRKSAESFMASRIFETRYCSKQTRKML